MEARGTGPLNEPEALADLESLVPTLKNRLAPLAQRKTDRDGANEKSLSSVWKLAQAFLDKSCAEGQTAPN